MAEKKRTKTRYVEMNTNPEGFVSKLLGEKKSHNFSDIKLLRSLLSNEKARILHALKTEKPKSIYALAKFLKRDFKSVRVDVNTLERFGFIEFYKESTGKRDSLAPTLAVSKLQIDINI